MGYDLEGRMAEVCSCKTYCPCTAGLEPDGGACDFNWVFHFDRGTIGTVDVSGLNIGVIGRLVGSPGPGRARVLMLMDDLATEAQEQALTDVFSGQAGGPIADLASLIGELVGIERVPIEFDVKEGSGRFSAGDLFKAEIEAHREPFGQPTKMVDFALSPVLGSVAYPGVPTSHELNAGQYRFDLTARSSEQFEFHHVNDWS